MQGEDVAANQASSVWVRVQLVQADEKIQKGFWACNDIVDGHAQSRK
jgi:hypothetical protein